MANRIPTFIDTANEMISEIPSGDALDLTGGSLLADGIETDTLTVNGVLYAPYDDSDLNARLDSEHAWNVAEHTVVNGRIDTEEQARLLADIALGNAADSEHAWNVTEHRELADSIAKEHAFNVAEHDILQYNINLLSGKVDSLGDRLDSELTVIDDKLDSLSLSIGGEINVEIDQIQDKLDGLTTDSVAEGSNNLYHTDSRVDSMIRSTVDSAYVELMYSKIDVFRDSNFVTEIVDSNYVNLRVDMIDSSTIITLIDSALTAGIISLDASPSGGASDDF